VSLFIEITVSKYSRNKIIHTIPEKKLSQMYEFAYKSKCDDVKAAMKQLNVLHNHLLSDEDLDPRYPFMEATHIASEDMFDIYISLVFVLHNPDKLDTVVQQCDAFTAYLDSISAKIINSVM
jgi:hypothetical protein